ncbi:MAG TPA: peptidoglycan-binding domain-containing protein [Geminicoccaceae bacterium]|nr:peptidoglycan-binding domain-containing protein [Geminicoccus sp.]HMU52083.1 peptidoglycan-binding domain-containing protein [Geminicoccaceae bacterium]
MITTSRWALRRTALAAGCAAMLGLSACAGESGSGIAGSGFGGGALAGAASAGTLAGVATRHSSPLVQTAAILGSAALGGFLGDRYVDQPREQTRQQNAAAQQDAEFQRRLDYDRQSTLQAEQTRKEIEEQRLFEQWKQQRGAAGTTTTASVTSADVMTTQRLLRGLGYYNGPLDGNYGPQTRSAIMAFERSQGWPATGNITPALQQQLRTAI